jgi:hypothetical protein
MPPKIYAANVEQVGQQIDAPAKPARTEKQIAAAEKAKLRRQAKKMLAQETPKETPVPPVDEKVKKPRKRKQTVKEADSSSETVETLVNEPVKKKTKKQKVEKVMEMEKVEEKVEVPVEEKIDKVKPKKIRTPKVPKSDDEPPKWFKSYIMGVKEEQARMSATRIPKKQVRFEADQEANEKWCEPVTRERVNRSVDHHMQSLYSMVFPNRKF